MFISVSLIKILSFATTLISDDTQSLGLPDFPIDNIPAIVHILVYFSVLELCSFKLIFYI